MTQNNVHVLGASIRTCARQDLRARVFLPAQRSTEIAVLACAASALLASS
jgi:hypothetical protein